MGDSIQVTNCSGTAVVVKNSGSWSEWSAWSVCSAKCNGGVQTRSRHCLGGSVCMGTPEETRECNKQLCRGKHKRHANVINNYAEVSIRDTRM